LARSERLPAKSQEKKAMSERGKQRLTLRGLLLILLSSESDQPYGKQKGEISGGS